MTSEALTEEVLIAHFSPEHETEAEEYAKLLNERCQAPDLVRYVVRSDEYRWNLVYREPVI